KKVSYKFYFDNERIERDIVFGKKKLDVAKADLEEYLMNVVTEIRDKYKNKNSYYDLKDKAIGVKILKVMPVKEFYDLVDELQGLTFHKFDIAVKPNKDAIELRLTLKPDADLSKHKMMQRIGI